MLRSPPLPDSGHSQRALSLCLMLCWGIRPWCSYHLLLRKKELHDSNQPFHEHEKQQIRVPVLHSCCLSPVVLPRALAPAETLAWWFHPSVLHKALCKHLLGRLQMQTSNKLGSWFDAVKGLFLGTGTGCAWLRHVVRHSNREVHIPQVRGKTVLNTYWKADDKSLQAMHLVLSQWLSCLPEAIFLLLCL